MSDATTALREIDLAAGGLLLRDGDGGERELAIVHRHRHDDWALPKGHPEPDESLAQAAVREVREETGCEGAIVRMLEPVSYLAAGVPKLVVFFEMELVREGGVLDPDEVEALHWMTPRRALGALSYPADRQLVSGVFGLADRDE